ncbi:MAG: N-acetylneuraminate synthase [Candidatus Omnitrophica bacterium CG11_big_fil_rev_8_21_14_0_20_63_9]|nr:MAG: N-acetylneuraminate synthase [Candidatus Omnitrophica bacterium CG11_big_fil_rev_8_21_14_0_20_63_9]
MVSIAGRSIGSGGPCFIVAEAGVNHNGDLDMARRLVDVAKEAGADAVKFQTFDPERLATARAPKAIYQVQTTGGDESQRDMLRRLALSPDAYRQLSAYCRQRGILFLSTPFDEASADVVGALDVPAFKIASGDVTNLPFLAHVARKGRPVILSTGMSTWMDVERAVQAIYATGNRDLILLHCVSNYPTETSDVNLRAMRNMAAVFGLPVGYSDHTMGVDVALAAVALGACVIEKHITLDQSLPGPDHRASLEPANLAALVRGIRAIEASLGHGRKEPAASEANTATVARKSVVAAHDLPVGTVLTRDDLVAKRPGTGIPPGELDRIVGRQVRRPLAADELLAWEDVG